MLSVAFHLIVIGLVFFSGTTRSNPRPEGGISVINTISDREAEARPEQDADEPVVDVTTSPHDTPFPVATPLTAIEAAASGPDGDACRIAAAIQADFLIDDTARAEIAAIPFDARSVANAIVLWIGAPDHVRPSLPATDLLVLKRLQSVPGQCLDLDQTGPDFIYAMIDNRTVSIAIGSGQWRWRSLFDLLSSPMRPLSASERSSSMRE